MTEPSRHQGITLTANNTQFDEAQAKSVEATQLLSREVTEYSAAARRAAAQVVTAVSEEARARATQRLEVEKVTASLGLQARAAKESSATAISAARAEQAEMSALAADVERLQVAWTRANAEEAASTERLRAAVVASDKEIAASQAATAQAFQASAAKVETAQSAQAASSKSLSGAIAATGPIAALGLAAVGAEAIKMAGDFQSSVVHLTTDAGESAANIGIVSDGLLKMAGETATSAKTLADGMYTVESAGFHGADGLTVMHAAAEGAKVGGAELATVTDAVTSKLNAYGDGAGDAVATTNQLIATTAAGKLRLNDLAGALSAVLPIAASNKVAYDQVGGAIATMTAQGRSAQQSTQDLASTIRSLSAPNHVATSEMEQFGLKANDVSQNLGKRGLTGTLELLTDSILSKMGPSGLVLQDSFNQSRSAGESLQQMLAGMPPNLQAASKGFLDGSVSAKQYKQDARSLGAEGAATAGQFLALAEKANGFNDRLKNGGTDASTYTAALRAMTGGQEGLDTALLLTGSHSAAFAANVKSVGDAAQGAGEDVKDWAEIQKTFNFQMEAAKQQVESVAVKVGSDLLPAVQSITHWLSEGHNATIVFGTALGIAGVAATVWAGKLAVNGVQALIGVTTRGAAWVAGLGAQDTALAANTVSTEAASAATGTLGAAQETATAGVAGLATGEQAGAVAAGELATAEEAAGVAASGMLGPIGLLIGAVTAVAGALLLGSSDADDFTESVAKAGKAATQSFQPGSATSLAQLNGEFSAAVTKLGQVRDQSLKVASAFDRVKGGSDNTKDAIKAYTDQLEQLQTDHQHTVDTATAVANALGISVAQAFQEAQRVGVDFTKFSESQAVSAMQDINSQALAAAGGVSALTGQMLTAANAAVALHNTLAQATGQQVGPDGTITHDVTPGGYETISAAQVATVSGPPVVVGGVGSTLPGGGTVTDLAPGGAGGKKAAAGVDEMAQSIAQLRAQETALQVQITAATKGTVEQKQAALEAASSMVQQAQQAVYAAAGTKDYSKAVNALSQAQREQHQIAASLAKSDLGRVEAHASALSTREQSAPQTDGTVKAAEALVVYDRASQKAAVALVREADAAVRAKHNASDHAQAVKDLASAQKLLATANQGVTSSLAGMAAAQQQALQNAVDLTTAQQLAADVGKGPVVAAQDALAAATRQLGIDVKGTAKYFQDLAAKEQAGIAVDDAKAKAAKDAADAQRQAAQDAVSLQNAQDELSVAGGTAGAQAAEKLREAQRALGLDVQGTTEWYRDELAVVNATKAAADAAAQDSVDLQNAQDELAAAGGDAGVQAALHLAEAQRALGLDVQGTTEWYRDQLGVQKAIREQADAAQQARQDGVDLANAKLEAGLTPGDSAAAAQAKVDEAQAQLNIDTPDTLQYFRDLKALHDAQFALTQSSQQAATSLDKLSSSAEVDVPTYLALRAADNAGGYLPEQRSASGGGTQVISVPVTVVMPDGRVLASTVVDVVNDNQRRNGMPKLATIAA